jgi:iron-sulfur cluster repair protein YtfE (RIC family)
MSEKPKPNIGLDLQRIHRVITRGLAVALENCQVFAKDGFPDDATREGFWKYCQGLEMNAHGHHMTEDDIFFPFLRERMTNTDFDEMMAEHQEMHGALAEMRAAREAGSLADMHRALSKLDDIWHPHIHKEETEFSPEIAAKIMAASEHIEMAQKAAAHSQEHAQPAPLSVPFLLYNLEADDRAYFLAVMPPEVTQQLVPVVWKDEWAPMRPFLLDQD